MLPLSFLSNDQNGIVKKLIGDKERKSHIEDMGINIGTEIKMLLIWLYCYYS